jgi:hypothetical protein
MPVLPGLIEEEIGVMVTDDRLGAAVLRASALLSADRATVDHWRVPGTFLCQKRGESRGSPPHEAPTGLTLPLPVPTRRIPAERGAGGQVRAQELHSPHLEHQTPLTRPSHRATIIATN